MLKFIVVGALIGWKYNNVGTLSDIFVQLICCAVSVWSIYNSYVRLLYMTSNIVWVLQNKWFVLQSFWLLTGTLVGFVAAGMYKYLWRKIKNGNEC